MTAINNQMIIGWLGSHATIPSGYSRETGLDGYFIKGWGDKAPNTAGGSAGHTHTSPAHTHTIATHTHTFVSGMAGISKQSNTNAFDLAFANHVHPNRTMDSQVGGNLSDAVTYASSSWEPPHQRLIFIKPNAAHAAIPNGGCLLFDKTAAPPNYAYETSMDEKFIKGADTSADPSQAGTATHEHAINHTHSVVGHYHTGTISGTDAGDDSNRQKAEQWNTGDCINRQHSHAITFSSVNLSSSAHTGNAGSADTGIEPLHKKIRMIKNTSGNTVGVPLNGIVLSLSLTEAPRNWQMKTALQNVFIKITNTNGLILQQAGSNSHSHAASNSHTHSDTTGAHTHTGSCAQSNGQHGRDWGNAVWAIQYWHTHPITNVSTNTASWGNATVSANSTNFQPTYKTVSFLELIKIKRGGATLANFL